MRKRGYARCAYPRFSLRKDNTFFSVSQMPINVFYVIGTGCVCRVLVFANCKNIADIVPVIIFPAPSWGWRVPSAGIVCVYRCVGKTVGAARMRGGSRSARGHIVNNPTASVQTNSGIAWALGRVRRALPYSRDLPRIDPLRLKAGKEKQAAGQKHLSYRLRPCVMSLDGDSYRIQTYNLLIRSQMLYSVELRSLCFQLW